MILGTISSTKHELESQTNELLKQIEELQREVEKNTLDIDSESVKQGQKINEVKKIALNFEKSITVLSNSQYEDSKTIADLSKHTEKEFKQLRDSIQDLSLQIPKDFHHMDSFNNSVDSSLPSPTHFGEKKKPKRDKKAPLINIEEHLQSLRDEFTLAIDTSAEQLLEKLKASSAKLQATLNSYRSNTIGDLLQLKEKLYWLPVNLQELKGMPPTEARIFILEARLRSEENIRNEQYNKLFSCIDLIKADIRHTSESVMVSHMLPSIASQSLDSRTPDMHRTSYAQKFGESMRGAGKEDRLKQLRIARHNRISMSVDLTKSKKSLKRKQFS